MNSPKSKGLSPQSRISGPDSGLRTRDSGLSPSNAVAVTPGAWNDHAARVRQAERIGSIENIVLRIMRSLESRVGAGATEEGLAIILREVCGPLASRARITRHGHARGVNARTAFVECDSPVIAFELRQFTQRLTDRLRQVGITEVRFR